MTVNPFKFVHAHTKLYKKYCGTCISYSSLLFLSHTEYCQAIASLTSYNVILSCINTQFLRGCALMCQRNFKAKFREINEKKEKVQQQQLKKRNKNPSCSKQVPIAGFSSTYSSSSSYKYEYEYALVVFAIFSKLNHLQTTHFSFSVSL